jgi:type VI secretion system protein ImpJ
MRNLRRVVWSRGMFLTPQHFQTADNWMDEALQFRFAASNFANWGVVSLGIQEESLANGLLVLHTCRGILPDGGLFSIPDPDVGPASREIKPHFRADQDALDVFLSLPERHEGGKNFAQTADPASTAVATRYNAATLEVIDENGYGESKSVQVANKNLRILFGDENRDGYKSLRVARVMRNSAGVYVLDPEFIPPLLDMAASEYLMNLLRRQVEILISKSNSLSAARRQKGSELAGFNFNDAAAFWLLHTVNTAAPTLQHLWNVRRGHPEAAWVRLIELAGALATFSTDPKARDLPLYDHDNLGPCFTALDQKIRALVETVIPSKCISIPLRQVERSLWTGTITNDEYFRNTAFFFAVSANIGVDELISKTPQLVKVSPPDEIQNLVRLALPGVTLRHAPTVPAAITFKLNNQYFTLNQNGKLWERIVQSRNISLFIPPEISDAHPELLVVLQ